MERFLQEFCAASGVTKAALIAHDPANADHRVIASIGDGLSEANPVYEGHYYYYQFDEWAQRIPKRPMGGVVRGEEVWSEELFLRSVFYNEFLSKLGICEMACLTAPGLPGVFDGLSFYRGPRESEFDREQLSMLRAIAPHLQTALHTRRKLAALESRVADLETALDRLDCSLVLLDTTGRAVFVNRNARAILDRNEGLSLRRGTLIAHSPAESSTLRTILAKAVGGGKAAPSPGAMLVSRLGRKPLQIVAAPFRPEMASVPGHAERRAVATVFITDPEQRTATPADTLRALFSLTRAESHLAVALLDGKSLNEAAGQLGVAKETLRSRIKNIFQKTGTQRQGELIRLLSLLPGQRTS